MANKKVINIVTTTCQPADEDRFNKWYNEVHIPLIRKYKGVKRVARYKVTGDKVQYLAVYHYDSLKDLEAMSNSPEFKAAIAEMNQSWPTGIEILNRQQCELIADWNPQL
jgi:uncharacterized protein (TIGR02118 family)